MSVKKYYTVKVEIMIESDSDYNAKDDIESYIDNLVSNIKELQDYSIIGCDELIME